MYYQEGQEWGEIVAMKDKNAFEVTGKAYSRGNSLSDTVKYYSTWAKSGGYEQDLNSDRYKGPIIAAETVNSLVINKNKNILDVGAGTGKVGEELMKRGFMNVDGLDPCKEMLEIAEKKQIYKRTISAAVTGDKTNIPDDWYDVLVMSGALGEGHIPCAGLKNLIRVTKKGGFIVIVMRKEYIDTATDYKGRLIPFMEHLQSLNYWECLQQKQVQKYAFGVFDGIIFVHKVNVAGFPKFDDVNPL